MKTRNVRKNLQRACEEVRFVSERATAGDVRNQLRGIAEQLCHASEGGSDEPEAIVVPERGALDTIQHRITDVTCTIDDPALVGRLSHAREEILLAIVTLEDQWKKQHERAAGDE